MRLWHKDFLSVLPHQQLLGQWRECCCIAASLANEHTPNHILVNRILDYPCGDYEKFCSLVYFEMTNSGFSITPAVKKKLENDLRAWRLYLGEELPWNWEVDKDDFSLLNYYLSGDNPEAPIIFENWHNKQYLRQCYYNLEEKYDCGGIPEKEWEAVTMQYVILGGAMK